MLGIQETASLLISEPSSFIVQELRTSKVIWTHSISELFSETTLVFNRDSKLYIPIPSMYGIFPYISHKNQPFM